MPTCSTTPWTSTAPKITLTINETSSTDTTVTYSLSLTYYCAYAPSTSSNRAYTVTFNGSTIRNSTVNIDGWKGSKTIWTGTQTLTKTKVAQNITFSCSIKWGLTWSGVYKGTQSASGSFTLPAKTSYTISYNANNGSGAPSGQTKWYGESLTLSKTVPSRTGYSFLGWSTSSSATTAAYTAGASYTANSAATLYAVWKADTYTVTYDANGGTNAPSSQTKTYGKALTLTTSVPTRTNYNFLGWGLSASSTTVSYASGASYTANSAITLYAVWELAYTKPRITNLKLARCDSAGTVKDDGTYIKVTFNWATDQNAVSYNVVATPYLGDEGVGASNTLSGTSGSVNDIIGSDDISSETTYTIVVSVTDALDKSSVTRTLTGMAYTIDCLKGGKGVAMFKPAEREGLDVNGNTYVSGNLTVNGVAVTGYNWPHKSTCPIQNTDDDTPDNWATYKNSIHWYNKVNMLTNQPSQYGFLMNFVNYSVDVHQLWLGQKAGSIYHRGGNASGFADWFTLLDTNNFSAHVVPKTGGIFTGFVQMTNTVNVAGYFRLHNEWLGMYGSVADAQAHTNRKGYIGFDGGTTLNVVNDAGGSNYVNKAWTTSSDERLKTAIEDIPDVFADIWKELQPKIFKWNELNGGNDEIQFGLIAQDVIATFEKYGLDYKDYGFVVPFKRSDDDTEYFSITYDHYHMLTALVLKRQQSQIDSLLDRIEKLESLISGS